MNKFKYITLGILLVGTTLSLNHLLQLDWPQQEDRGNAVVQNDVRDASIGEPTGDLIDKQEAPSLRDRILGRRETETGGGTDLNQPADQNRASPFQLPNGSPSLAHTPKDRESQQDHSAGPGPVEQDSIDDIVVPDFSHLDTAILDTDGQSFVAQTDPPRLIKIPDPPKMDRNWTRHPAEPSTPANVIADKLQLPPSHRITPRQLASPGSGLNSARSNDPNRSFSRKTGIPFGLNQQARSELGQVHHRSEQVQPATTNFLDHTTEPGDSLQSLSDRYYGRPDYYLDIYIANQDKLVNPSTLPAGMIIKIPIFQD